MSENQKEGIRTYSDRFIDTFKTCIPEAQIEKDDFTLRLRKYIDIVLPIQTLHDIAIGPEHLARVLASELLRRDVRKNKGDPDRLAIYRNLLIEVVSRIENTLNYKSLLTQILASFICLNCQGTPIEPGEYCTICGRSGI